MKSVKNILIIVSLFGMFLAVFRYTPGLAFKNQTVAAFCETSDTGCLPDCEGNDTETADTPDTKGNTEKEGDSKDSHKALDETYNYSINLITNSFSYMYGNEKYQFLTVNIPTPPPEKA